MEFIPEVNPAAEFLEISNDFSNPKEIIREALSNSFDAAAKNIKVEIYIDKSAGEDELVISLEDDGHGMDETEIKAFFGLGFSMRTKVDERGYKISSAIGEKGHGTKIYFNSRRIEVTTCKEGKRIAAYMDLPRRKLRVGKVPEVEYEIASVESQASYTHVKVIGYNDNKQQGFDHNEIKDYIYWFTKFGSIELELGIETYKDVKLFLKGLGANELEELEYGHRFADVNTNAKSLLAKDKVSPLDYYVARLVLPKVRVVGHPNSAIDIVFFIEGDEAKREYNKMIHRPWVTWKPGEYTVGSRYGFWLCKDYMPIQKKNEWVSEKSEWTKYHAFANCQDFRLTANRGGLENTAPDFFEAVGETIRDVFKNKVMKSKDFQKYQEELLKEQVEMTAEREQKAFEDRRKSALSRKIAKFGHMELLEPRQESGVYSLVLQLKALDPNLFDFKILDYDTSLGYDLLVTTDSALDLNQAAMRFVEMKYELKRTFNHSFKKLAGIICWDCKLTNDEEVTDLTGEKRYLKITNRDASLLNSYKKYMLCSYTTGHNIEVFVLKDFLKDKLSLEFRPRGTE